ncbi:PRC-barrel domain-containing protein [Leptospira sp. 201903070]|uniref:PRC-barrel domain-containing protein n=1 Tax=Leptospira ainlahdjerensis TaxID=2810033 RepID=A0ABS2UFS2_9LEPT|nr:PRC-barrel domain-containing protein [Leptospira ainlahdjerensis]MBM9579207.1 PRC-barrel domain-containing protein [Leptospira ainlahdjerensis]
MPNESNIITSDDILGKEALDPEGQILGVVVKLHIDRNEKKITGITIDQGFMKPDLFVGIDFVRTLGVDAILLNTIPFEKYKGLKVLNSDGSEAGIVEEVISKNGKLEFLLVKTSLGPLSKERTKIPSSKIQEIGDKILLKRKSS